MCWRGSMRRFGWRGQREDYNGWGRERMLRWSECVLYLLLSASVVVVVLQNYNGWGKERILRRSECVLYLLLSASVVVVVLQNYNG